MLIKHRKKDSLKRTKLKGFNLMNYELELYKKEKNNEFGVNKNPNQKSR